MAYGGGRFVYHAGWRLSRRGRIITMADRYQDRPFPDETRGADPRGSGRSEGDPLAELARLIGQTDPFGNMGRGNPQVPPRTAPPRNQYQPPEPDRKSVV